jgi:hypothetical protein
MAQVARRIHGFRPWSVPDESPVFVGSVVVDRATAGVVAPPGIAELTPDSASDRGSSYTPAAS